MLDRTNPKLVRVVSGVEIGIERSARNRLLALDHWRVNRLGSGYNGRQRLHGHSSEQRMTTIPDPRCSATIVCPSLAPAPTPDQWVPSDSLKKAPRELVHGPCVASSFIFPSSSPSVFSLPAEAPATTGTIATTPHRLQRRAVRTVPVQDQDLVRAVEAPAAPVQELGRAAAPSRLPTPRVRARSGATE